MNTSKGFTLLEVIVALAIMAFLALITVRSIQNALKTRTKVQKEIDKTSTLRDALRIIERDINMAFNYRDINIELYNLTQKERELAEKNKKPPAGGTPGSPPDTPPPDNPGNAGATPGTPVDPNKFRRKTEKIYTHFIGDPESISLTTVSNIRMMEDSKISSQAEIGYHIKSCKRRSTQEQSSKCLWRRVSNFIHEDITKHGDETVLLENIVEFKLRYLGPGREEEWVDNWFSNERGDDKTKGKFPYAVEITIEMKDPTPQAKDKTLRMTTVAALRNPNNPAAKTDDPNAPATGQQPNAQQ